MEGNGRLAAGAPVTAATFAAFAAFAEPGFAKLTESTVVTPYGAGDAC